MCLNQMLTTRVGSFDKKKLNERRKAKVTSRMINNNLSGPSVSRFHHDESESSSEENQLDDD